MLLQVPDDGGNAEEVEEENNQSNLDEKLPNEKEVHAIVLVVDHSKNHI